MPDVFCLTRLSGRVMVVELCLLIGRAEDLRARERWYDHEGAAITRHIFRPTRLLPGLGEEEGGWWGWWWGLGDCSGTLLPVI